MLLINCTPSVLPWQPPLIFFDVLFQKHSFILMYEERFVDVASYVCHILDQIPASPVSPMYVD